jgi:hypothetical protein
LGNPIGIRYYLTCLIKFKQIPEDYFFRLDDAYKIDSITFLPQVLAIFRLHFSKNIIHDQFKPLDSFAIHYINRIVLNKNNFHLARIVIFAIIAKWKILKKLRNRDEFDKAIKSLKFYLEGIEKQFYINKGEEIILKDAGTIYENHYKTAA